MPSVEIKNPQAELQKILANAEKAYGKGAIHKASESVPVNRLPFVGDALNYATEGGPGFGRFMAAYGDENSGKSRIAFELIAQAQQLPGSAEIRLLPRIAYHTELADDVQLSDIIRERHSVRVERLTQELEWLRKEFPHGADAVYYNSEMQFDPVWAQKIGVDLDRLEIFESTTIEEISDMMYHLYPHFPLHVVDSTSNASSLISQKHEMGKNPGMGLDARQWKLCLRDSMTRWDEQRNLGILIHQLSTNIKTGGSNPASTRYMRFISRLSLRFNHGKFLWEKDGVLREEKETGADDMSMAGMAEADGRQVYAKVDKSTTCRPFRIAGMQWHYKRTSFVQEHELAAAALYYGIIVKSGSWFAVAGESENLGQGLKVVYQRLIEDEPLRDLVRCRMLDFTSEG